MDSSTKVFSHSGLIIEICMFSKSSEIIAIQKTCKYGNYSGLLARKKLVKDSFTNFGVGGVFAVKYEMGWYERELGWNKGYEINYCGVILAIGKIIGNVVMLMDDTDYSDCPDEGPYMPLLKLKSEVMYTAFPVIFYSNIY